MSRHFVRLYLFLFFLIWTELLKVNVFVLSFLTIIHKHIFSIMVILTSLYKKNQDTCCCKFAKNNLDRFLWMSSTTSCTLNIKSVFKFVFLFLYGFFFFLLIRPLFIVFLLIPIHYNYIIVHKTYLYHFVNSQNKCPYELCQKS